MAERSVCVIPARAGSKTIKDKNLIKFGGKTLVRIALEQAMDSKLFTKVIITSDYERFQLGIEGIRSDLFTKILYIKRPTELATDTAEMVPVVQQALNEIGGDEHWVWLLQPTSPFRSQQDFKKIKKILDDNEYKLKSLISFAPPFDHSDRIYSVKDNQAKRLRFCNYKNKQQLIPEVTRSGNFYITRKECLFAENTFENEPYYSYFMGGVNPENMSLDEMHRSMMLGLNIDNRFHLILAKHFLNNGDVVV